MKKFIYFLIVILLAFTSCEKQDEEPLSSVDLAASKQFFTVIGQSNPAVDIPAVQNAVDNHDRITLSGEFDFGSDETTGGVDITREGVILQGPATILNGAKTQNIPELGTIKYPISIGAPGVELRELEINSNYDGILVYVQEDGKPVVIYGNTVGVGEFGAGVAAAATPGGIRVFNNSMEALFSYFAIETTGTTEIAHNEMVGGLDCVFMFGFDHKVDIMNNSMSTTGFEGIFIGSWPVTTETGPDWGDNPPVRIIGNTIDIEGMDAAGIVVGTSAHGINNTLVKGNTITGNGGFSGLLKEPYGRNNRIINNDLTGLTTYGPQIWVMGGTDNHYQNNKLGSVVPIPGGGFVPAFKDAATLVSTINWHEFEDFNTPDPLNQGNHFSNNDYSNTGVLGWTDDPDSYGAVLLLDFILKFDETGNLVLDPFIMENFVNEKRFPTGTDVCNQVLDLNPGTNHIVGSQACESSAKKATYKLVSNEYKNFGQFVKERHLKRTKALEKMRK